MDGTGKREVLKGYENVLKRAEGILEKLGSSVRLPGSIMACGIRSSHIGWRRRRMSRR